MHMEEPFSYHPHAHVLPTSLQGFGKVFRAMVNLTPVAIKVLDHEGLQVGACAHGSASAAACIWKCFRSGSVHMEEPQRFSSGSVHIKRLQQWQYAYMEALQQRQCKGQIHVVRSTWSNPYKQQQQLWQQHTENLCRQPARRIYVDLCLLQSSNDVTEEAIHTWGGCTLATYSNCPHVWRNACAPQRDGCSLFAPLVCASCSNSARHPHAGPALPACKMSCARIIASTPNVVHLPHPQGLCKLPTMGCACL